MTPLPLTGPLSKEKGVSLEADPVSQILSKQKWKVLNKQTLAKEYPRSGWPSATFELFSSIEPSG